MTAEFALRTSDEDQLAPEAASRTFDWLPDRNSTIYASVFGRLHLGPSLGALGDVPEENIDLVRIATAVFAADRSVPRQRGGADWNSRDIALTVPVLRPARWRSVCASLEELLGFLTGDRWSLKFSEGLRTPETEAMKLGDPQRVVLFSGGADSLVGALKSRSMVEDGKNQVLVSHYASTTLSPVQRSLVEKVDAATQPGAESHHVQIRHGRSRLRLDHRRYRDETSTRSRSLLFIALGLAVASIHQVPLWIAENGFASINPPLGMDRLGTLSTHTTHPTFLSRLAQMLKDVGGFYDLSNPYARATKGEMFAEVRDRLGASEASALLGASFSCAHTGQRNFGVSIRDHCGVCFGCVVRRASFKASGLTDPTSYLDPAGNPPLKAWLGKNSVEPALEQFLARGVTDADLVALDLPLDYKLADARNLCERGMAELAEVFA